MDKEIKRQAIGLYNSGWSINQIAERFDLWYSTVRSNLIKDGVEMRTSGEGTHLALMAPNTILIDGLLEIVDGILLGDGTIDGFERNGRLTLGQSIDHIGWIEQVKKHLETHKVLTSDVQLKVGGPCVIKGKHYTRQTSAHIKTRQYEFFAEQRKRWYPDGLKIVPKDIVLTPQLMAMWHCGDGTIGGKGYRVEFCTDGFTRDDVRFIIEQLQSCFGWRPLHDKMNRIVICKSSDRMDLIDMVSAYMPECFAYKLLIKRDDLRFSLTQLEWNELLDLRRQGYAYGQLMKRFDISKSAISDMCIKFGLGGRRKD